MFWMSVSIVLTAVLSGVVTASISNVGFVQSSIQTLDQVGCTASPSGLGAAGTNPQPASRLAPSSVWRRTIISSTPGSFPPASTPPTW